MELIPLQVDAMSETTKNEAPIAAKLQALTDEDFVRAWHEAIEAGDEPRVALIEGNASHRFGTTDWQEQYASRHPEQTRYKLRRRLYS